MFKVFIYRSTANLGDAIQTWALCRLLGGECRGAYRDEVFPTDFPGAVLVMNGWLSKGQPPDPATRVVAAGIHLGHNHGAFLNWIGQSGIHVGARDPYTDAIVKGCGLPSTCIGCATLTLDPYRGPRSGRFSVDVGFQKGMTPLTNAIGDLTWSQQWELAEVRLDQLRKAELVVTNRLHVILPCLAFHTPVLFPVRELDRVREKQRLSILHDLGFAFGEEVVLDVSAAAARFQQFLQQELGSLEPSPVPWPVLPLPPHSLDRDAPRSRVIGRRQPRMFYFCDDSQQPALVNREAYHHVDVLNRAGLDAYAVHGSETDRARWFDNDTRVIGLSGIGSSYDSELDYIVLPGKRMNWARFFSGRKVFLGSAFDIAASDWHTLRSADIVAGLVFSNYEATVLRDINPAIDVWVVQFQALPGLPCAVDWSTKRPIIALAPGESRHTRAIFDLIAARAQSAVESGNRFDWIRVDQLHENERIGVLNEAAVLVCSGLHGNLSVVLQGMACGCLVLTDDCPAFREWCLPAWAYGFGDLLPAVEKLEQIMASFPLLAEDSASRIAIGHRVAAEFSQESMERTVLAAWRGITTRGQIRQTVEPRI